MGVIHVFYLNDFDFRIAIPQTWLTHQSTSLSLSVVIPLFAVCRWQGTE